MQIVKDSQSTQLDLESIGIKGAALRHLRSLRLYVPKFSVLTSGFFEALAEGSGFAQKARFAAENITDPQELAREFTRLVESVSVPAELDRSLDETLRDLSGQGSLRVVARPSRPYMSKLDSRHHLNLTSKAEVLEAIMSIFAEHFSQNAVVERVEKGLPAVHLKLPIILQVFVNPDVTGIIMPYRNRSSFYYITAWKGFGFELDFHIADHYLVNYRDLMLERFLNNTSGETMFFEESSGSISRTKIIHEEAKEPFLDHDQIIDLCKLYAEHASDLGGLAIEFKIKGKDLFFISLKDAALLDKAERALEDLRTAPSKPEAEPEAPDEALQESDDAPREVPSHDDAPAHEEVLSTPSPEPDVPKESVTESRQPEVDEPAPSRPEPIDPSPVADDLGSVPEVSHGSGDTPVKDSDEAQVISRIIAKYIEINPTLERQFRLLEQDLLDALR